MKTTVKISMNDVEEIVNNISYGKGKLYTALEKALAYKCKRLYDNLVKANDEKNRLFGILYSNYIGIPSELRKGFDDKRCKELTSNAKAMADAARQFGEVCGIQHAFISPPYATQGSVAKFEESKSGDGTAEKK